LCQELKALDISPVIKEQEPFGTRGTSIDLLVGRAAIEIKAAGIFSSDYFEKYGRYRAKVEEKEWVYLYLTIHETNRHYRELMEKVFGKERAFFLDTSGDWERFIKGIKQIIG
jgi:hypothetical protein